MNLPGIKHNPTVSIVLPTFNRAGLIGRAIRSVLSQSYGDFELIVIDDGSKDSTKEAVESLRDSRIKYIRLEENRGAGTARNFGIRRARGRFIAFQDSDDEWLPEKLEKQMNIFERKTLNLGVVYSDMERVLVDKTIKYHRSPKIVSNRLIDPATQFYQVCMLGIQSSVIRRECFDRVGHFNENIPSLEDLDLFIRLSRHYDFYHIEEPLVRYHENEGLSKNMQAQYSARKLLLRLYFRELIQENKNFLLTEFILVHLGAHYETIEKTMSHYLNLIRHPLKSV